jgi:2Fe-2S ferredoxin
MENVIKNKETALSKKSSPKDICKIYVIDELGEERSLTFRILEYNNLMDLVLNEMWEEWGDCRGQAMCGTCHVEILNNRVGEMDPFEANTLDNLPNKTSRSRLACQIIIDKSIHNMRFRILKDF